MSLYAKRIKIRLSPPLTDHGFTEVRRLSLLHFCGAEENRYGMIQLILCIRLVVVVAIAIASAQCGLRLDTTQRYGDDISTC